MTTKTRSGLLPEVPTIAEAGVPGFDKAGWYGLFAPSTVPEPVLDYIYSAVARVLKDAIVIKRLAGEGAVVVASSPREFEAFVRAEIETWAVLIRDLKL